MKFTPKELQGNVNVSSRSPVKEFFYIIAGLLLVISAVYVMLGFAVDVIAVRMPYKFEKKLGGLYRGLFRNHKSTPTSDELKKILDRLVRDTEQPGKKYELYLVESKKVNALALPGGVIVVYTGLTDTIKSENEQAFVLAHELGHFKHRDHLKGLGRGMVIFVISAALLGQDNYITRVLMNSLVNLEMKFSQRQETDADMYALELVNREYDHVEGALMFFDKLSKKEKRSHLRYFFATHPHPETRLKHIKQEIKRRKYKVGFLRGE